MKIGSELVASTAQMLQILTLTGRQGKPGSSGIGVLWDYNCTVLEVLSGPMGTK